MICYNEIRSLTLGQVTDELAAAGWDSAQADIDAARDAVARLVSATQGCALFDSETGDRIRAATDDEAASSINAGYIIVDGRKCYVA